MISKLDKDLNYHQKLPDRPNANDGLTPSEVKERFDQGVNDIKEYINDTLTTELDDTLNNVSERIDDKTSETTFLNHASNKSNPHEVTKVQVGLSNLDNVKQASKTEFDTLNTSVGSHIANGVLHTTQADKDKLASIEAGAEKNQNAFSRVNNIQSTSKTDTLNIEGGTGITITNNPTTKKVTITATGEALPGPHGSSHNSDGSDPIPELVQLEQDFTALNAETAQKFREVDVNPIISFGEIKLAAHRGCEQIAPENTIPAFETAYKMGYEWVETDISDTLDNEIVLMHDETVDRMTNGTGKTNTLTLSQIKSLNIDAGANVGKYPNLKVPTLEEFLVTCKKYGLKPILEIKSMKPENFPKLIEILIEHGFEKNCIILVAYIVYAEMFRELNAKIAIMYLDADVKQPMVNRLVAMGGAVGLGVMYNGITKQEVLDLHSKKIFVNTWTIDSYSEYIRHREMGVDIITTGLIGEVR